MKTAATIGMLAALACAPAHAQHGASASNMALVGQHDLQGRSAYQPVVHAQGDALDRLHRPSRRQRDESAHRAARGQRHVDRRRHRSARSRATSRTFPASRARPRPAARRWCACAAAATLPKGDPAQGLPAAHLRQPRRTKSGTSPMPEKPARVAVVVDKLKGTHKNWWECDTGIAYLVSGAARLAHAAHDADLRPVRSGEAGVHPQLRPGRAAAWRDRRRCRPSCTGRSPPGPKGNRVYFGYGTNKSGVDADRRPRRSC